MTSVSDYSFYTNYCTSFNGGMLGGGGVSSPGGGGSGPFGSPSNLQEAHLILSTDAELKMAILLGTTAFLGSLVFISCIMLVATNQQLRRIKAEAAMGNEDLKRTNVGLIGNCKFDTVHGNPFSKAFGSKETT